MINGMNEEIRKKGRKGRKKETKKDGRKKLRMK